MRRVQVGSALRILGESADGLQLEGRVRLRPGQPVEVVRDPPGASHTAIRSAWVHSWAVASLGDGGTIYRGLCRWQ